MPPQAKKMTMRMLLHSFKDFKIRQDLETNKYEQIDTSILKNDQIDSSKKESDQNQSQTKSLKHSRSPTLFDQLKKLNEEERLHYSRAQMSPSLEKTRLKQDIEEQYQIADSLLQSIRMVQMQKSQKSKLVEAAKAASAGKAILLQQPIETQQIQQHNTQQQYKLHYSQELRQEAQTDGEKRLLDQLEKSKALDSNLINQYNSSLSNTIISHPYNQSFKSQTYYNSVLEQRNQEKVEHIQKLLTSTAVKQMQKVQSPQPAISDEELRKRQEILSSTKNMREQEIKNDGRVRGLLADAKSGLDLIDEIDKINDTMQNEKNMAESDFRKYSHMNTFNIDILKHSLKEQNEMQLAQKELLNQEETDSEEKIQKEIEQLELEQQQIEAKARIRVNSTKNQTVQQPLHRSAIEEMEQRQRNYLQEGIQVNINVGDLITGNNDNQKANDQASQNNNQQTQNNANKTIQTTNTCYSGDKQGNHNTTIDSIQQSLHPNISSVSQQSHFSQINQLQSQIEHSKTMPNQQSNQHTNSLFTSKQSQLNSTFQSQLSTEQQNQSQNNRSGITQQEDTLTQLQHSSSQLMRRLYVHLARLTRLSLAEFLFGMPIADRAQLAGDPQLQTAFTACGKFRSAVAQLFLMNSSGEAVRMYIEIVKRLARREGPQLELPESLSAACARLNQSDE